MRYDKNMLDYSIRTRRAMRKAANGNGKYTIITADPFLAFNLKCYRR